MALTPTRRWSDRRTADSYADEAPARRFARAPLYSVVLAPTIILVSVLSEGFALDVRAFGALLLPAIAVDLGLWASGPTGPRHPPLARAAQRLAFPLRQLSACSLIVLSDPAAASLLAFVPVAVACHEGFLRRKPVPELAEGALLLTAFLPSLLMAPTPDHIAILALAIPTVLGGYMLFGALAQREAGEELKRSSLRAAVRAQILEEKSRDLHRLSSTLEEILDRNRVANNALSTALMNAEILEESHRTSGSDEAAQSDTERMSAAMVSSLSRLKLLIDQTRRLGLSQRDPESQLEAVELVPVAQSVLGELRRRYPRALLSYRLEASAGPNPGVVAWGGEPTLHRILENILVNACEGDGRRTASRVNVTIEGEPSGAAIALRIEDDGPGFDEQQLATPLTEFTTTKPGGSGLGLYTSDRLIRAGGGSMQRFNSERGGAVVCLYLNRVSSVEN